MELYCFCWGDVDDGDALKCGFEWCYLYFLRNSTAITAVAITETALAIIEEIPKPSGACSIYAIAIEVQKSAGISPIMYGFSFLIR